MHKKPDLSERNQQEEFEAFRRLHVPGDPIVLYNIWDPGSAVTVAKSGAKAIATSSWAVAKANGFNDGEQIPLDLAIQNLRRIVAAVELPVTFDIESGYGDEANQVARNISLAIEAGAVGCNLEDSIPATGAVRDVAAQVTRIRSARKAADNAGVAFFINARCDLFFQGDAIAHDEVLLAKVVDRAHAYAEAGGSGFFVPGLTNLSLIFQLAKKSPIPINILADSSTNLRQLADNGAARVSYGAAPYVAAMAKLEQAARGISGFVAR
jgi:methylisocitrate lyase